jgi:hypothetical protein
MVIWLGYRVVITLISKPELSFAYVREYNLFFSRFYQAGSMSKSGLCHDDWIVKMVFIPCVSYFFSIALEK